MERKASVQWKGNIQQGQGEVSTESGVLNRTPYSFSRRFGTEKGTNPEELIAAAHSSCFAMALSAALTQKGFTADTLNVNAAVSIEKNGSDWVITHSNLSLRAKIPGIDQTQFKTIAEEAKSNCPVSRLLDTEISLDAVLDEGEARATH
ncbi:OsmC family protein [Bdellovibrio sp. SKB1291214]|uniref:OsmC family protein n=1 Tax=Bdellovibrio sp. SKB1291214 TaxID=1732569 RepID=UPI000B5153BC|nr:OsmC family protein [Bdellovibrio sp. SKB1291214]UYL09259.1 OsmC family protein [Bdellovibrio sp. SKB1291214]